jgi:hypothetical protein
MKLTLPRSNRGLCAAAVVLALAALAGVVTGREKPSLELVEARPARQEGPAPTAVADIDLAKLQRPASPSAQGDPFAPRSFAPPPQPARAARAEKPNAPPLPFTYVGRVTQDGVTEVFVARGDELISIAAGQNIDTEYRVDAVSGSRIAFTYLPLKTKQSLELEEAGG